VADRYAIIVGDPQEHRSDVLALGRRNLPGFTERRFVKYYERNPLGPPRFVLARESPSGHAVGMAALFPTRVRVGSTVLTGAIAGDFAVDREHRGFGPARKLQRTLLANLDDFSFVYGTPNRASEPLFRYLGYRDLGRFSRYVKPLRAGFAAGRITSRATVERLISRLVDPLLARVSAERRHRRAEDLRVVRPDTFDERFEAVWEAARRGAKIMPDRNPTILNWKWGFLEPQEVAGREYSLLALARPDGLVTAYAVFTERNGIRRIVDLLFLDETALDDILAALILDARAAGAGAVFFIYLGASCYLTRRLRVFGFLRLEAEWGAAVYAPDVRAPDLLERRNWFLLEGDADR
jgi:GNAT superfamily N-acetyltransferase